MAVNRALGIHFTMPRSISLPVAVFLALATTMITSSAAPLNLIFDTDMDSDCDDAGALALLHARADAGDVTILATTVSSKHRWSAPCVDAINTYFGRPDIPIGVPKGAGPQPQGSKFARRIAEEFPQNVLSNDAAPDARRVYRQALASQADGSVVIVTVGDLTNLRDLLATGPDQFSPLPGPELVRAKVKHWVCMGSRYPADLDPKPWGNFKLDPDATVTAVNGWPGLITFTGGGESSRSFYQRAKG